MLTRLKAYFRRSQDIGSEEFERLSIIQRTKMSEVWLARRKRDGLITITKIARVDKHKYIKANQEAIRNEANWLRRFRNEPRIIQFHHSAETTLPGNPYFIAAEYLDGGTLEDLLAQPTGLGKINNFFASFGRATDDSEKARAEPNLLRFLRIPARWLHRGHLPVEQALQIFGTDGRRCGPDAQ